MLSSENTKCIVIKHSLREVDFAYLYPDVTTLTPAKNCKKNNTSISVFFIKT